MLDGLRTTLKLLRAGNPAARLRVLRDGAGALRSAALGAGIETGVLPALASGPRTEAELTSDLGVEDARLMEPLLRTLAAARLVGRRDHGWELTRLGSGVLEDDSARAAAEAYGGLYTQLYQGLPAQLAGGPGRDDIHRHARLIARVSGAIRPFQDAVVADTVRRVNPTRVVDVGCGAGEQLALMLTEAPAATGVGIDVDPAVVALARQAVDEANLGDRASVFVADPGVLAGQLGNYGGAFDLALLANVVYYVLPSERVSLLVSLRRLLQPGGTLLVVTTAAGTDLFSSHFDLLLRAQHPSLELPDIAVLAKQAAKGGFTHVTTRRLTPAIPLYALTAIAPAAMK